MGMTAMSDEVRISEMFVILEDRTSGYHTLDFIGARGSHKSFLKLLKVFLQSFCE